MAKSHQMSPREEREFDHRQWRSFSPSVEVFHLSPSFTLLNTNGNFQPLCLFRGVSSTSHVKTSGRNGRLRNQLHNRHNCALACSVTATDDNTFYDQYHPVKKGHFFNFNILTAMAVSHEIPAITSLGNFCPDRFNGFPEYLLVGWGEGGVVCCVCVREYVWCVCVCVFAQVIVSP